MTTLIANCDTAMSVNALRMPWAVSNIVIVSLLSLIFDRNPQVKYSAKTDSNTDYSKLRVKQLKAILAERGVTCRGCTEKGDFVRKAMESSHLEL